MTDYKSEHVKQLIDDAFEAGQEAGRIANLDPVKEAEIYRLLKRISELEQQQNEVGHKNPSWEKGAQWGLYTMPDEIAMFVAKAGDEPTNSQLKTLFELVKGVMTGVIKGRR